MPGPVPRSPLVIDLRDTRREGGLTLASTVPAPGDLGVALAAIPEGSDLHLDLLVQQMPDGVLVRGDVRATVRAECARCLEPISWNEQVEVAEFFRDPQATPADEEPDEDAEDLLLEGDVLDLEPVVRDAVVLQLPLAPVCQPDCAGLCPECGARLADDPAHHHEATDPRWSALNQLLDDDRGSR